MHSVAERLWRETFAPAEFFSRETFDFVCDQEFPFRCGKKAISLALVEKAAEQDSRFEAALWRAGFNRFINKDVCVFPRSDTILTNRPANRVPLGSFDD